MKTSTIKNVARKAVVGLVVAAGLVTTTGCDPVAAASSLAGMGGYGGGSYSTPTLQLPPLPQLPRIPFFPF